MLVLASGRRTEKNKLEVYKRLAKHDLAVSFCHDPTKGLRGVERDNAIKATVDAMGAGAGSGPTFAIVVWSSDRKLRKALTPFADMSLKVNSVMK